MHKNHFNLNFSKCQCFLKQKTLFRESVNNVYKNCVDKNKMLVSQETSCIEIQQNTNKLTVKLLSSGIVISVATIENLHHCQKKLKESH